jgi:hypothetical protein
MRKNGKSDVQGGLSWFLVTYLMLLLGVLLGVHVLQSSQERPAGALKSPARQERPMPPRQAAAAPQPGAAAAACEHAGRCYSSSAEPI